VAHRAPRQERQPDRADLRRRRAPLGGDSTAQAAPSPSSGHAPGASPASTSTTPSPAANGSPSLANAYDAAGNLAAAFDTEGHPTRYQYDDEHRLTREIDPEGLAFSFVYDREGRCVETWGETPGKRDPSLAEDVPAKLADGTRARGVHHVRLDYGGGLYTEVSDSTQVRRYFGNEHGLVDKQIEEPGVEETTYDDRGLVLSETDGEGAVTRYQRDDRGQIVRVTDPLGRVTTTGATSAAT